MRAMLPSSLRRTSRGRLKRPLAVLPITSTRAIGLPARQAGPEVQEDGVAFPPPAFNLASALHHTCGEVAFIHECTGGARYDSAPEVTHEQILDFQMLLYDELVQFAVERSVRWV